MKDHCVCQQWHCAGHPSQHYSPSKVHMVTPRRGRNTAWIESQESQLPIHSIILGNPEELHSESKEQGDVNNATLGSWNRILCLYKNYFHALPREKKELHRRLQQQTDISRSPCNFKQHFWTPQNPELEEAASPPWWIRSVRRRQHCHTHAINLSSPQILCLFSSIGGKDLNPAFALNLWITVHLTLVNW